MAELAGRKIVLGVGGGGGACASPELCSRLVQAGAVVDVVLTETAAEYVRPLTFEALTHRRVYTSLFEIAGAGIPHVALAEAADLVVVAPLDPATLARLTAGLAGDLLGAVVLATSAPLLLAVSGPAAIWRHPATQRNAKEIASWGAHLLEPPPEREAGPEAAAGATGMAPVEQILRTARELLATKAI